MRSVRIIQSLCAVIVLAAVPSMPALASGGAGHVEAATERAPGAFDHVAFARRQQALHARLMSEQVPGGLDAPLTIQVDPAELDLGVPPAPRMKVGVTRTVSTVVDFGDLASGSIPVAPQARGLGAVRGTARGGFVWTGAIRSEDASALRVRFTNFFLPDGAELYLYNPSGEVRGPYTGSGPSGDGTFWSHTVAGSLLILQVSVPPGARGPRAEGATFDIAEVGHLGPRFRLGATPTTEAGSDLCGFNASCVRNASCASIPAAIQPARDADAMIEFVSGGFIYICSGGLVADTDTTTQIPYFITAHHCLSRQGEADTLEAFFQFSIPCGGTCFDPNGVVPSTLGSDVMATDKATDYTLLRLRQAPPAGSAFLGWSSTPVAFSNGVALFRISHPKGAPQAYSTHVVDTSRPTCRSWPRGDRIYSSDVFGATEGGSSGSLVLNAAGQVVGELSGACGYNVSDPCDAASNATVDGAFAAYFDQVSGILAPSAGSTTTTTTVTTTTAISSTTSTTATTSTSTTTTTATSSTTSTTVGGTCAASGEACTTASDCCSGTCRGRPGSRTCK
jgi:lysyl endopeptidase